LNGFDEESGDVSLREFASQPIDIPERDHRVGKQRVEAAAEFLGSVDREGTRGQPVERVVAIDNASAASGVTGEFQRGLDGLRAAVAEVGPIQVRRRSEQPLGQYSGKRRRVELRQVGKIGIDDIVNGLADDGMVAPESEHPEAGQHVEVFAAVRVVEVGP
jgi:hypothetical protein